MHGSASSSFKDAQDTALEVSATGDGWGGQGTHPAPAQCPSVAAPGLPRQQNLGNGRLRAGWRKNGFFCVGWEPFPSKIPRVSAAADILITPIAQPDLTQTKFQQLVSGQLGFSNRCSLCCCRTPPRKSPHPSPHSHYRHSLTIMHNCTSTHREFESFAIKASPVALARTEVRLSAIRIGELPICVVLCATSPVPQLPLYPHITDRNSPRSFTVYSTH